MLDAESQEDPRLGRVLDSREQALISRALAELRERPPNHAQEGRRDLLRGIDRLHSLWEAIEEFPRTQESQTLGWRKRNLDTLLDRFTSAEDYSTEAVLPTRAALARAFAVAKFNFTRLVRYVLVDHIGDSPEAVRLLEETDRIQRSAVAAIISEDVLRSIASDTVLQVDLRRRAAKVLSELWDQRATQGLADFAPMLDLAWRAKACVTVTYGTLQGVSELFSLMAHGCPEEFLETFGDRDGNEERYLAFEEFVFNATHEDLLRMRRHMETQGSSVLSDQKVADLFDIPLDRLHTTTNSPKDMFFTFREREMWARLRRLGMLPGPKKTAEEYVMIYVLERAEMNASGLDTAVD